MTDHISLGEMGRAARYRERYFAVRSAVHAEIGPLSDFLYRTTALVESGSVECPICQKAHAVRYARDRSGSVTMTCQNGCIDTETIID